MVREGAQRAIRRAVGCSAIEADGALLRRAGTRPRNPTLLPFADEDIELCIVDGKGDCGIDFISREKGVVLLIQAKYSGGKKAAKRPHEEPADFEYFRTALGRLRDHQKLEMTEPLREVAAEIDWETDRFQMHYITLR
jgi:hypothetical protein